MLYPFMIIQTDVVSTILTAYENNYMFNIQFYIRLFNVLYEIIKVVMLSSR